MSNRTDVATHVSLSLPSFAQAFSSSSINSISNSSNALPPIHSQSRPSSPPFHARRVSSPPVNDEPRRVELNRNSRKRAFRETSGSTPDDTVPPSPSPVIRVKEEPDREDLNQPSITPCQPKPYQTSWSANEAPVPSSTKPFTTTKRRRVTISGINTDVKRRSPSDANTPISPVVMGFTIMRDDPSAIEQVRSMLNVKQQQKALIEQRRSSNAGLPGTASPMNGAPTSVHVVNGPEIRHTPTSRRSPIGGQTNTRRITTNQNNSIVRNPTPPPLIPGQQPPSQQDPPSRDAISGGHALPPLPISFAHRMAARPGAKSKPADILISPREAQSSEQIQPSIMSAPPVPHAGAHGSGRFAMALPSLPTAVTSGHAPSRVTAGVVPPTPTRLGGPRSSLPGFVPQVTLTGRSPPTASVPISSTLVPPTPASLHRPSYTSEKTAFLAPFETFYDALSDSKQLKRWLGEQLQKSNALISSLQKQDGMEELIESLVEKKVMGMREEIYGLRRRVEELESALRLAQGQGYQSHGGTTKGKAKAMESTSDTPESYTFPPVLSGERPGTRKPELTKGISSPSRAEREVGSAPGSQVGSPAPYETGRRLSVSSIRFEPRSGSSVGERSQQNHSGREGKFPVPMSSSSSSKVSRSPVNSIVAPRPQMHRQHSQSSNTQTLTGPRKHIGCGSTEKHREAPEDLNFVDNGGKRSVMHPAASPQTGREDHWRRESGGVLTIAGPQRSNSSGEGS